MGAKSILPTFTPSWEQFDIDHADDDPSERLAAFKAFCAVPLVVSFPDVEEDSYFAGRSKYLRRIGLDPEDDDSWAMPDNEARPPLFDWYWDAMDQGFTGRRWCVRCLDDYAHPGTLFCGMCAYERDRELKQDGRNW